MGIADRSVVLKAAITGVIFYVVMAKLFGPVFAALLITALLIHESGHLWAMKVCGMGVRALYFIPLVGAAAVPDRNFPSRKTEAFMSIMGPAWGFLSALSVYCLYLAFGSPYLALIAKWVAIFNFFNLIPVSPMDGGRVVKSLCASVSPKAGLVFLAIGPVLAIGAAFYTGIWILTLIAYFAYEEYRQNLYGHLLRLDAIAVREGLKDEIDGLMEGVGPDVDLRTRLAEKERDLIRSGLFFDMVTKAEDILRRASNRRTKILGMPVVATPLDMMWYPSNFISYLVMGSSGSADLMPRMSVWQIILYGACYLALGGALAAVWLLGDAGAGALTYNDLLRM